jgi:hypothetical protein
MSPPKKRRAAPGKETARAKEHHVPENRTADLHQREEEGSFSEGDPDRPRWDNTTVLEAEYDYEREDGSYSHTVLKGRRADGEKAFLNGRRFAGSYSDLQLARQDGRKFYPFPGITHFETGAGE